jgi:membrane-associated protease RseP (regulator of RpoE activity)
MHISLTALGVCALAASVSYTTLALAAPSVGEVLDANRGAMGGGAWDGKATLKLEFAYAGQGMTGKFKSLDDLNNGYWLDDFAIGPATGANGFDGVHTWSKDPSGTVTLQDGGEQLPLAINDGYRRANLAWRADRGGAAIVSDGEKTDGGATYDVLTVTPKGGKNFDVWFDSKTHLMSRIVEMQGTQTMTSTLSDYRAVDGVEMPYRQTVSNGDAKYDQAMTLTSAVFLPAQSQTAYSAPKVTVADFSIARGAKETTFPFKLINNHIYADVSVDGKGPYQFIFDTGGVNLLTPPLAKELNLKSEGQMQGNGAGAGHMDVGMTKVDSLQLGDAMVKDQIFAVIPLNEMSVTEGVPIPGMVGYETFRRFVTRVDYGTGTITLIRPDAFDPKDAGVAIPVVFDGNTIEVQAIYKGATGKFTIDTGARSSVTFNGPFAAKYNLAKDGKGIDAVTGWGIGGPTRSVALRGDALSIGPMTIKGPVVELSTDKGGDFAAGSIAGNIGAGILKRYIVTLDYEHSTIYLKPVTRAVADLDTFDRAGLWINESDDGYKVVDVTKDAPSDTAGLKVGDDIVAVDGKPAKSVPLYEVRKQLRDEAPGTVVTFTVKRGGDTKSVAVTLRDLI